MEKITNISLNPSFRRISASAIDALKILAMVGVVLIHSKIDVDGENAGSWITSFISEDLCSICVPCFFFISGMLFFKNLDGNIERKLKSRVSTLLIPYLLWNCIGAIALIIKVKFFGHAFPAYLPLELTPINLLRGFWSYSLMGLEDVTFPFDFTLWFLSNLIVIIPVALVLYKLFRTSIWILPGLYLVFVANFYLPENYGLVRALCYFYAGGVVQRNIFEDPIKQNRKSQLSWDTLMYTGVPTFIIWCLVKDALPQIIIEWGFFPIYIFAILGLIALFSRIYHDNRQIKKSIYLKSLFFIYAAHGLWVNVAGNIAVSIFKPETSMGIICAFLSKFLLLWYVNMLIFIILQKITPRLMALLTGKRN